VKPVLVTLLTVLLVGGLLLDQQVRQQRQIDNLKAELEEARTQSDREHQNLLGFMVYYRQRLDATESTRPPPRQPRPPVPVDPPPVPRPPGS
jgi:hypothetical protein